MKEKQRNKHLGSSFDAFLRRTLGLSGSRRRSSWLHFVMTIGRMQDLGHGVIEPTLSHF